MKELMEILSPVLGDELAEAVIEHRKRTVKKPLTAYAAKLQVKEYLKTGDPQAAAEMQILRGWQAIRADWYFNEIQKQERQQQRGSGRRTVTDAAIDLINRADNRGFAFGLPQLQRH
jgi:hypothetical protein